MKCPECASDVSDQALACPRCGHPLQQQSPAAALGTVAHEPPPTRPIEQVTPQLRTNLPDFVKQALHPSELILAAYSASLLDHQRSGQIRHDKFVLTDERIIYFHTGLIHKGMGEMPYRVITSVAYNKGWAYGKVVLQAANASLTISGIGNNDAAFAEKLISSALRGCKFELAEASTPAQLRKSDTVVTATRLAVSATPNESERVQLPRKVLLLLEPRSNAATRGSIRRGANATILKTQDNWVWIQADDGVEGWIGAAALRD